MPRDFTHLDDLRERRGRGHGADHLVVRPEGPPDAATVPFWADAEYGAVQAIALEA